MSHPIPTDILSSVHLTREEALTMLFDHGARKDRTHEQTDHRVSGHGSSRSFLTVWRIGGRVPEEGAPQLWGWLVQLYTKHKNNRWSRMSGRSRCCQDARRGMAVSREEAMKAAQDTRKRFAAAVRKAVLGGSVAQGAEWRSRHKKRMLEAAIEKGKAKASS